MKENKYKNKYKRWKKALWAGASGSVVTGLIVMGAANTALADTVDNSTPAYSQEVRITPMHTMRRWKSRAKVSSLAVSLGLDPTEVNQELNSGKTLKQVLQEHDIVPAELQKAFGKK